MYHVCIAYMDENGVGFCLEDSLLHISEVGWDGRLVNQSYQWVERVVAFQPQMREWQSGVRDGMLEAGVLPYNGFTYDHMYGTKVGGTIFDQDGHRHTAADLLEYANPSGLTVLLHAPVHKILFTIKGTLPAVSSLCDYIIIDYYVHNYLSFIVMVCN